MNTAMTTSAGSDAALLARFLNDHDENAFAELVNRYRPMVRALCRRKLGGNVTAAEDAEQTVFVLLARKAGSLSQRHTISGWLCTTLNYVVCSTLRTEATKRKHMGCFAIHHEAISDGVTPSGSERQDPWEHALDVLPESLASLPESFGSALTLRYLCGMQDADAARTVGCSLPTFKKRLQRARLKLHSQLSRRGVALSFTALVTGLEAEATELLNTECRMPIGENAEVSEHVGTLADAVSLEMDRAATNAMWRKIGWMVAGVATIGLGTALVVSHLQTSTVAATSWRIESVTGAAMARRGETVRMLKARDSLCMGDTILTSSNQETVVVTDDGDRILVREDSELGTVEEGRAWASSPRRGTADVPFLLTRGAVVAQVNHPTWFATPHALIDTEGSAFFLIVAKGVTTNGTPWSFTRTDVTEGSIRFQKSQVSDLKSRIWDVTSRRFAAAGWDREGKAIETVVRESTGREMSPKYGGAFFRKTAKCYDDNESTLGKEKVTDGRIIHRFDGEELANVGNCTGGKVSLARNTETLRTVLDFANSGDDKQYVEVPMPPMAPQDSVAVECLLRGVAAHSSRSQFGLESEADFLPEPIPRLTVADSQITPLVADKDVWLLVRREYVTAGQLSNGDVVYEVRVFRNGRAVSPEWVISPVGVPRNIRILAKSVEIQVDEVTVKELVVRTQK